MVISFSGISCCVWIPTLSSIWVLTSPNWSPCPWVVLNVTFTHLRVSLPKNPFHSDSPTVHRQQLPSPQMNGYTGGGAFKIPPQFPFSATQTLHPKSGVLLVSRKPAIALSPPTSVDSFLVRGVQNSVSEAQRRFGRGFL